MRLALLIAVMMGALLRAAPAGGADELVDAAALAARVPIHRDEYGVPHIFGADDESTIFGFGYAQAEDFFWQVEDAYILALGRYSEVHGPQGLNSDLLNRAFEIVPRSERDFAALDGTSQRLYAAFVAGINQFLKTHPETRPRLIQRFEPWHVLAYYRHVALELTFRFTGLSDEYLPRRNPQIWAATGSNAWALSGSRTASGAPLLLAAPHMPWFGFTQLAEAHLHSAGGPGGESWNFIGAGFYGSPTLAMGHNDRLGWTLVTNMPDIADAWSVRFSHPTDPLAYEYNGDWRQGEQWSASIGVRKAQAVEQRTYTFRKTHHGPVVERHGDQQALSVAISGLFEAVPLRQSLRMFKARNLEEFRTAVAPLQMMFMNVLYADCEGNTWFLYNGRVPRRNPAFDWSKPVDGSNPKTEWLGVHELDELPQVLNPAAGFLQNCNSTPFAVTDGDNPLPGDFPPYMVGDREVRNRRSLRSLEILRGMPKVDFAAWQAAAFDTEVYWARHELPRFAAALERLKSENPPLASEVAPYLEHLLAWDCRITAESTEAPLCHAWYDLLHGGGYPGETLRPQFQADDVAQLRALVTAAETLESLHGAWRVPYGELYRAQRRSRVADLTDARFDDDGASLPLLGGHGPMGVALTQYYSPSVVAPLIISQRRRYGMVGASYMAAWQFAPEGVHGASLVPFGASGDPLSPHYFDQAALLSERRMKPERFTEQQVMRHAVRSYHPGAAPASGRVEAAR
ncbi:MAG TPA: penicillin acylase family protein [Lacipirellulaceae bacterium]|nr:penicillin acylase family protein [Lacipirellulaceae bacterium]